MNTNGRSAAFFLSCIITGSLLFCGAALSAQQTTGIGNTTSTPVAGVPHDYITGLSEIVNPANGALSVRIKAPTPHERGSNWPLYAYTYDSNNVYSLVPVWQTTGMGNADSYTGLAYLYLEGQTPPNSLGENRTIPVTIPTGQNSSTTYNCQLVNGGVFTDPDGGRHGLGLSVAVAPQGGASACNELGEFANYYVGGDEQYKAVINPNTLTVTIVDLHGDQPTVEDTNGNHTTVSGSGSTTTLTTPTGRAETLTTSASGYTWSLPGVSGQYSDSYVTSANNIGSITIPFTDLNPSNSACQFSSIKFNNVNGGPTKSSETLKLPNGDSYTFSYDPNTGFLNKITYPTGAWVQYTWTLLSSQEGVEYRPIPSYGGPGICAISHSWFAITKRVVSNDGSTSDEEQDFTYSTSFPPAGTANSFHWTTKTTTVVTKDLLRNTSFQTVYTYSPMQPPPESASGAWEDLGYVPQEQSVAYYDTNGSLLKTINKTWKTTNLIASECETTNLGSSTATKGTFYQYAPYTGFGSGSAQVINPGALWTDLKTDVAEYDYGTGIASACTDPRGANATPSSAPYPTRETWTTYTSLAQTPLFAEPTSTTPYNTYTYASILDRPAAVQTYAAGTLLAETDYYYDGSTTLGTGGTTAPSIVSVYGQDSQYASGSVTARGNLTNVVKKCIGSATCVASSDKYTYDTTGQVLSATNTTGATTTYSYIDEYVNGTPPGNTNAYPTKITKPLVNVALTTTYTWGYLDGKMRTITDENNQTTTYCYETSGCSGTVYDPFYRLTGASYPDTGQEKIIYSDAGPNPSVTSSKLLSGNNWLTTEEIYNAVGLPIESELVSDPQGTDYIATTYDGLGHVWKSTNPYRSTSDSTYGVTTYTYDALDRKVSQTQPDNSTLQWCYNDIASQGQGNCSPNESSKTVYPWTDSSDEIGLRSQRVSDGLGRLVAVLEPTAANVAPSIETDYTYDGLNNLTRVDQWGGANGNTGDRVRTFAYNSLSQLVTSSNPETGTITYTYDPDGNVSTRTDARRITTEYLHDKLNRLLIKQSSDGATPAAHFNYDETSVTVGSNANSGPYSPLNAKGRLTSQFTGSSEPGVAMKSFSYDAMGRPIESHECWGSECSSSAGTRWLKHQYDLAGDLTLLDPGTNQTFPMTYNNAGWLSDYSTIVYNADGSTTSQDINNSFSYTPWGAQTSDNNGVDTWSYDNRMRVTSYANTIASTVQYGYNLTYQKNGVVATSSETSKSYHTGTSYNWTWTYVYDSLNRLTLAVSDNLREGCQETYDAWGNRLAQAAYGTGDYSCNQSNSAVNTKNQVSGMSYDASGNLLQDLQGNVLTYDAEGRISQVQAPAGGGVSTYTYGADGQRVSAQTPNGNTYFVHDTDGKLLVRWQPQGSGIQVATQSSWINGRFNGIFYGLGIGIRWAATNWLGSERMVYDPSGNIAFLTRELPFGDGATTVTGSDSNTIRYTGKERDAESGNDYFGARYYASTMGRFISPDWSDPAQPVPYATLERPQSLNLYSYVENNPLSQLDDDGHSTIIFDGQAGTITVRGNDGSERTFDASNNPQLSLSIGKLVNGNYEFLDTDRPHHHSPSEDSHNGAYGPGGIFRLKPFKGADGKMHEGVGVHAGRAEMTDRAGRSGCNYATNGCVRTTESAIDYITRLALGDPLTDLQVQNNRPAPPDDNGDHPSNKPKPPGPPKLIPRPHELNDNGGSDDQ